MHTIIPAMATKDNRVQISFGVMGGYHQAMGQEKFLSNVLDYSLDLQKATELPRLFPVHGTNIIEMATKLFQQYECEFERRGFKVTKPDFALGGAQAIWINWENGIMYGTSDHRKDRCTSGFWSGNDNGKP